MLITLKRLKEIVDRKYSNNYALGKELVKYGCGFPEDSNFVVNAENLADLLCGDSDDVHNSDENSVAIGKTRIKGLYVVGGTYLDERMFIPITKEAKATLDKIKSAYTIFTNIKKYRN